MTFCIHVPAFPLSQYINRLWYIDDQVPYQREKILPTATIELIINFSDPHHQYTGEGDSLCRVHKQAWLVGLHTHYITNEPTGGSHMIGVSFKPGGASAIFDFPFAEVNNDIIALDLIWGDFIRQVREHLYDIPAIPAKFTLLEQLLLQQLSDHDYQLDVVQYAVEAISNVSGVLSIRDLCDDIGISQKHLSHLFRQKVGVAPKAFARIMRLQHVLYTIDPTHVVNWTDVAHKCHYYDQSHFNRDFLAFTGIAPSEYLDMRLKIFDTLQPGESVHFVPVIP